MTIIDQLTSSPKRMFQTDAIGALVTALLLSQLVARFERFFGMPKSITMGLAAVALLFFVYSLSCSLLMSKNWRPFLRTIAYANSAYCLLTVNLLFAHTNTLTIWGYAYFLGELLVVLTMVRIELRMALKTVDESELGP
ncbi:MAG: hypothetical protein AAGA85_25475 [Bacteroidota bacterium]